MDEPDEKGGTRLRRPKFQHGDKIVRHLKFGAEVPYSWIITKILGVNAKGTCVRCEVQIDTKGTKSLK